MIRAAIHFQKLDITIEEFYDRRKNINEISKYEYNKNTLLIRAIKAKDLERITKMVKENSFIVLDCDMVSKIY
jgi:ribosomal protein L10